jgi:hypothetical protein
MPLTRSHIVILICTLASASSVFAQDASDQLRKENAALKAENAQLRDQLRQLQDKLLSAETDRQQLTADKQKLVAQSQKIVAESDALFITSDYDDAANTTTLSSRSWDMDMTRGAARYHWLSVEASFKGKTAPDKAPAASINFQSYFTGGVYGKIKEVTLTADGQALRLPVTSYENRYRRGGTPRKRTRKDDEFFSVALQPDQLAAIANAKTVTGEMGRSKFNLTNDQIASFKTLARQLNVIE